MHLLCTKFCSRFSFARNFFILSLLFLSMGPVFAIGGPGWNSTQICDQPGDPNYAKYIGVGSIDTPTGGGTGQILPGSNRRLMLTAKHVVGEGPGEDKNIHWPSFKTMLDDIEGTKVESPDDAIHVTVAGETILVAKTYLHPTQDITILLLEESARRVPESNLPKLPYFKPWIGDDIEPATAVGCGLTGKNPKHAFSIPDARKRQGDINVCRDENCSIELASVYCNSPGAALKEECSPDFIESGDSGGPAIDAENFLRGVTVTGGTFLSNKKWYHIANYIDVQAFLPWMESAYRVFGFDPSSLMALPDGFNPSRHVEKHPGLAQLLVGKSESEKQAIIKSDFANLHVKVDALSRHFHQAPPGFEAAEYVFSHEDLARQYGKLDPVAMKKVALRHWFKYGRYEGRILSAIPEDFDENEYLCTHLDIYKAYAHLEEDIRDTHLRLHWLKHGRYEGRSMSDLPEEFNFENYILSYPDLMQAFGDLELGDRVEAADAHWLRHGRYEGRAISALPEEFDAQRYILSHLDLKELYSGLRSEIMELVGKDHWLRYGRYEGRSINIFPEGFKSYRYVFSNPDLVECYSAFVGHGCEELGIESWGMDHWLRYGQFEKRTLNALPAGFQGHRYVLSNGDLKALWGDLDLEAMRLQGELHYFLYGVNELHRPLSALPAGFQGHRYVLSNGDLEALWGHLDPEAMRLQGELHYLRYGARASESHRLLDVLPADFQGHRYILSNGDLKALWGHLDPEAMRLQGELHYLRYGVRASESHRVLDDRLLRAFQLDVYETTHAHEHPKGFNNWDTERKRIWLEIHCLRNQS